VIVWMNSGIETFLNEGYMIRNRCEPMTGCEPTVDVTSEPKFKIPRVGQVWTYTGKRMDIIKGIVRVKNKDPKSGKVSKKRIYAVQWESNMVPTRVRDLLRTCKYVGFFLKLS
jgi:hypothetical protein